MTDLQDKETINIDDHNKDKILEAEAIIESKDISNEEKNQAVIKLVKHNEDEHNKDHHAKHNEETEEHPKNDVHDSESNK